MNNGKRLIDALMKKYCFTRFSKLAEHVGFDQSTINRLYNGKTAVNATHILMVYDTCGMSIEEIRAVIVEKDKGDIPSFLGGLK